MPSPFPGMNPYLERSSVWHDFHERYVPALAEALGESLSDQYVVRIDDHVYVHELDRPERRLLGRADVAVSDLGSESGAVAIAAAVAPAQAELPEFDEERLSYIEIRDRDRWTIVTVIELLSPANKYHGPDRAQYLSKRWQHLHCPVHYIEIDLLRGGPRAPFDSLPACDYYVMVSRWQNRPRTDLWPIGLRERLPIIPVPLSEGHPDVLLDLQPPLHRVYDGARYGNYIYRGDPEPRLSDADQQWAQTLIAQ